MTGPFSNVPSRSQQVAAILDAATESIAERSEDAVTVDRLSKNPLEQGKRVELLDE